jgi:hypothetical protein
MKIIDSSFRKKDFVCKCCGKGKFDARLFFFLEELRKLGIKYQVSSAFRCKKHNDEISGSSKTSKHLAGLAVDINFNVDDHEVLGKITDMVAVDEWNLNHINYSWGLHLDTRKQISQCIDILPLLD